MKCITKYSIGWNPNETRDFIPTWCFSFDGAMLSLLTRKASLVPAKNFSPEILIARQIMAVEMKCY